MEGFIFKDNKAKRSIIKTAGNHLDAFMDELDSIEDFSFDYGELVSEALIAAEVETGKSLLPSFILAIKKAFGVKNVSASLFDACIELVFFNPDGDCPCCGCFMEEDRTDYGERGFRPRKVYEAPYEMEPYWAICPVCGHREKIPY